MRWVLALVLVLAACSSGGGDGPSAVLGDAEAHLADLQAGTIDLQLAGSAKGTGPVGFRVQGPFSFDTDEELPVLDLTYTQLLGDEEEAVRVTSDGTRVRIEQDGRTQVVPEAQVGVLRLGDGGAAGLQELGLQDWAEEAHLARKGDRTTVTGVLDAAAMLQDLNRLVAEVAGRDDLAQLDDGAAERLNERVRDSSLEVVTQGDDHRLRSLRATIDFGSEVPAGLEDALGPYAAAQLELRLALGPAPGD